MQTKRLPNEDDGLFLLRCLGMSALAGIIAENCTISLDVAKVRLQIQSTMPGQTPKYTGLFQCLARVSMEEGPRALF